MAQPQQMFKLKFLPNTPPVQVVEMGSNRTPAVGPPNESDSIPMTVAPKPPPDASTASASTEMDVSAAVRAAGGALLSLAAAPQGVPEPAGTGADLRTAARAAGGTLLSPGTPHQEGLLQGIRVSVLDAQEAEAAAAAERGPPTLPAGQDPLQAASGPVGQDVRDGPTGQDTSEGAVQGSAQEDPQRSLPGAVSSGFLPASRALPSLLKVPDNALPKVPGNVLPKVPDSALPSLPGNNPSLMAARSFQVLDSTLGNLVSPRSPGSRGPFPTLPSATASFQTLPSRDFPLSSARDSTPTSPEPSLRSSNVQNALSATSASLPAMSGGPMLASYVPSLPSQPLASDSALQGGPVQDTSGTADGSRGNGPLQEGQSQPSTSAGSLMPSESSASSAALPVQARAGEDAAAQGQRGSADWSSLVVGDMRSLIADDPTIALPRLLGYQRGQRSIPAGGTDFQRGALTAQLAGRGSGTRLPAELAVRPARWL